MTIASIPVDLLNPGQVFACLGLAEIALVLHGDARGAFDWSDRRHVRFHLGTSSTDDPIRAVLGFLEAAEVVSVAPEISSHRTDNEWKVRTQVLPSEAPFPNHDGQKAPQLPGRLCCGSVIVDISYWGDTLQHMGRDGVKFWGGAKGKPGVAHVSDALASVRGRIIQARHDPFNLSAILGSCLRLEWRGSGVPLDLGFSPNSHKSEGWERKSFPLVEVLAAVGLSHARPQRIKKLEYRYGVISRPTHFAESCLPLPLLRAAAGAVHLPFPQRTFTMHLGWANQPDKDRVITSSVEEFSP